MKKRIDVRELRVGMYVSALDRSWMDTPFLNHRFPIREEAQIREIRALCGWVEIDTERGADLLPARAGVPGAPSGAAVAELAAMTDPEVSSFEVGFAQAARAHRDAGGVLAKVLDDVRLGHSVDTKQARAVVKELTESVVRDPSALLCLTQLKDRDLYTSQHSVNVCIFSLAFARHIGIAKEKLHDLGLGALLHDIGKMRVPLEVLNKPGPLTADEFAEMRRHPEHACKILSSQEGVSETVLDVVRAHHERVDGSGYPRGVKSGEISLFARLVGIVDVYDAITSARVYHDPISPLEAMKRLYQWRYREFDTRLVEKFIQCLGVYPAGSLVEMSSGEVGVVIQVPQENRTRPVVKLLLDGHKRLLAQPRVVDLKKIGTSRGALSIRKVLDPLAWRDTLGSLWEQELYAVSA